MDGFRFITFHNPNDMASNKLNGGIIKQELLEIKTPRHPGYTGRIGHIIEAVLWSSGMAWEGTVMQTDRAGPDEDSRFRILTEISQQVTSILDINELLVQVVRLIQRTFDYYHVGIGLVEKDEIVYRVGAGELWDDPNFQFKPQRLKIGAEGITGMVAFTGRAILVPDVSQEPYYVWMQGSLTRSELTVPITVKGKTIGVLDVQSKRVDDFKQTDLELIQAIANQTGVAIENARLFSQIERRAEQFRVLAEVSQHIISLTSADELVEKIARTVRETFGYLHVGIGLVEDDFVVSKAEVGEFQEPYRGIRVSMGNEAWGWVAQHGQALITNTDTPSDTKSGIFCHLCVPLKVKNQVIGVISAESNQVDAFDESDKTILQLVANQAGVAIDNVRLYEQSKHLAVLDERQRLARELHDSVTQSLYGISLYAQAATGNINADQIEQAGCYLEDIQNTAQESLADMRLLIYELKPPVLDKEGLIAALKHRLISVEDRARIKTSIETNLPNRLPSNMEEGLYQIAREALNNIIKHAHAKSVSINIRRTPTDRIQCNPALISMEISDDGVGFNPRSARRAGCLGLVNMQERAQSQGWQLEVSSSPGKGTRIKVEIVNHE
ncbi:MAG: GAF domain-containing protein [Chloroflexi bacterium CFX2]|nr:GAF domain-containing protein [Chloroflexi bacterium CFX2]